MSSELREACGVFGIYAPGVDVARVTFFGLYSLQHRGQESAGIATGDGSRLRLYTHMGLVSQVFSEAQLADLPGTLAVGHTRYSTTGSSKAVNAQPILIDGPRGRIAIAHNGNIVNSEHLRDDLRGEGHTFSTTTDTEIIGKLFVNAPGHDLLEAIQHVMPRLQGAYSLVVATQDAVYAVRDPFGIRPLCLGKLDSGWVVSSESCALDTIGAAFVREIQPGEVLRIDEHGLRSITGQERARQALCVFEYIYFARPDSVIKNRRLYLARQQMGRQLAQQNPVDADIVIPVPDSAVPAAIGYAQESGIRFSEGLIKSRYIGRTFIQPDQRIRDVGIGLKFNPLPEVLQGKRVVVVDDSIVRGTTTRPIVRLLRRAGAREVHVRIHAPPMCNPCYLGVDTARQSELIASRLTVPQIADYIEADSLDYLSLERLVVSTDLPAESFCLACFTGDYPVPVQLELDKFALERT